MPRVVIDLRMVGNQPHGISRYAWEMARRIPLLRPQWDWIGLSGPDGLLPQQREQLGFALRRCSTGFLSPWEQLSLPASLKWLKPDLFHATSFSIPVGWQGNLVVTLHDAIHLLPSRGLRFLAGQFYYRSLLAPRIKAANSALITVSHHSQRELARQLRLGPHQFTVTPLGASEEYLPSSAEDVRRLRVRYGLPEFYFLVVGNQKPHKNLKTLAAVSALFPAPLALLAGYGASNRLGFASSTVELPAVPEEEMPALYSGALALMMPSLDEGFGLPALEAMACGCPVIFADAGALPEILGDAGLSVPALQTQAWLDAADRLFSAPLLRDKLRRKGLKRAKNFSWNRCAMQTLQVYEQALSTQLKPA